MAGSPHTITLAVTVRPATSILLFVTPVSRALTSALDNCVPAGSSTGTGGGGGEYPLQDGFGWTNGVTLKMLDLLCPKEKPCDSVPTTRPAANDDVGQAANSMTQPAANEPATPEDKKATQ